MLHAIRRYLLCTADAGDAKADLVGLISEVEEALTKLGNCRSLLTSSSDAKPHPDVIQSVQRAIDVEVDVVINTEIKSHHNPEPEKFDIQRLLSTARGSH